LSNLLFCLGRSEEVLRGVLRGAFFLPSACYQTHGCGASATFCKSLVALTFLRQMSVQLPGNNYPARSGSRGALTMLPFFNINSLPDCRADTCAQVVRVHGVKLPARCAVVRSEPSVARIASFGLALTAPWPSDTTKRPKTSSPE
jgi:hypothetical protein